jgi:hypothetical protein
MKNLIKKFREIFHRDLVIRMNELQNELYAISEKLNSLNTPPITNGNPVQKNSLYYNRVMLNWARICLWHGFSSTFS